MIVGGQKKDKSNTYRKCTKCTKKQEIDMIIGSAGMFEHFLFLLSIFYPRCRPLNVLFLVFLVV